MENSLRPNNPSLYKLLKFGRSNINTSQYWDNTWKNDTINRRYTELFQQILKRVPEGAKILDTGCGIGNLSRLLRDERGAQVTALDFSSWACAKLAEDGFTTIVSKLPKIPLPDNTFDIVIATEVMEHLDHPERTLAQMVRVAKPGGVVMCSAPNDTMHPHEELEHQQSFDHDKMENMLRQHTSDYEILVGNLHEQGEGEGEFLLGIMKLP